MAILEATTIETDYGPFRVSYHENSEYEIVSFSYGELSGSKPTLVRIHSACLFGEALHSLHCDCDEQLEQAMSLMQERGSGVIIYSYQEGRGIGLLGKIKAMQIERATKCDTVEAFKKAGYNKSDYRTYDQEVKALQELGVGKSIAIFSGNSSKLSALKNRGFEVTELLHIDITGLSPLAKQEIKTKKNKLGYKY